MGGDAADGRRHPRRGLSPSLKCSNICCSTISSCLPAPSVVVAGCTQVLRLWSYERISRSVCQIDLMLSDPKDPCLQGRTGLLGPQAAMNFEENVLNDAFSLCRVREAFQREPMDAAGGALMETTDGQGFPR